MDMTDPCYKETHSQEERQLCQGHSMTNDCSHRGPSRMFGSTAPNSAWVKVMRKKKGKAVTQEGTLVLIHQAHCRSGYERGAGR